VELSGTGLEAWALTLQNTTTTIQNHALGSFHVNDAIPKVKVLLSRYNKRKHINKKIKRKG